MTRSSIAQAAAEIKRGVMEDGDVNHYYSVAALLLIAMAIAELTEKLDSVDATLERTAR